MSFTHDPLPKMQPATIRKNMQKYAEMPKQYAEMPKQKHPKQKHADDSNTKTIKAQTGFTYPQGIIKKC